MILSPPPQTKKCKITKLTKKKQVFDLQKKSPKVNIFPSIN